VRDGALVWLFPALCAGAAAALGARSREDPRARPLLIGLLSATGIAVLILAETRDPEVTDGRFVQGLLLGGLLFGVVPFLAYFALGRWLSRRPGWLVFAWLVALVPFYLYSFFALIIALDLIACTPDAYECPL
jgi:hypothetical protein